MPTIGALPNKNPTNHERVLVLAALQQDAEGTLPRGVTAKVACQLQVRGVTVPRG